MTRSNPGVKLLDKTLGAATFGVCGLWDCLRRLLVPRYRRGRLPDPQNVHSVLIIKLCCLGDGLLTIPAIRALRSSYPRAAITVLCTPRSHDAYVAQTFIDKIILVNLTGLGGVKELLTRGARGLGKTLRAIRRARPDIAVDLDLYFKVTPVLAFLSGAPVRVGFDTEGCSRAGLFTHSAPRKRTQHELLCFLDVVSVLGVTTQDLSLSFPLSLADHEAAAQRLTDAGVTASYPLTPLRGALPLPLREGETAAASYPLGRLRRPLPLPQREGETTTATAKLIALCPGSSRNWPQKQWPAEFFARVADNLVDRLGANVVLLGAAHETEVHSQVLAAMTRLAVSLAGKTSVREMAGILTRCELLVTNDTGPMHLAAALDVPTVAIFGPTDERKWRPWHRRSRVVRVPACDRAPCYWLSTMPECETVHCLAELPPEAVLAAAEDLLSEAADGAG